MDNYNNRTDFSSYTVIDSRQTGVSGAVSKKFMAGVFSWMFAALGISAIFAVLFASSPALLEHLLQATDKGMKLSPLGWIITLAPLGFIFAMTFAFQRLSPTLMTAFFLAYAACTGMSLSFLLLVYTTGSVVGCFATASIMFGVMAVMGYTTDKDLTSFGSILMMGLVGMIIAMMVNWFMHSQALAYVISLVGVAVFTGLTAYDVQKLKRIGAGVEYGNVSAGDTKKLSLFGALTLYLDFINLFIMLLRVFGNRRD
ncbi:MAG: Bax inhibitor-1/YccA family protein [Taibaiella sp.]|nr:Bax inhibitor-1/YccA family protein [Taibaiella sp.]